VALCSVQYARRGPAAHRYPAALLESLQPDKPNALQLLGLDLVAWRTPEGDWSVLEVRCGAPHPACLLGVNVCDEAFRGFNLSLVT
jgi:phenylpropionate dioxygenase-like ring-hydroxylating dioxygenase large terminal subunit